MRERKKRSIARQLIASVLLMQLISALGVVGVTLAYERHTRFQAFDVMLRGRADSLLGAVQDADDKADNVTLDRTNLQLPAEDLYQVQDAAGRVLGKSENWNRTVDHPFRQTQDGIFRAKVGGLHYRLIRMHGVRVVDSGEPNGGTAHTVIVVYGSQTRGVWKEIRQAVAFYTAASTLLLLVTASLVSWLLQRALLPLRELVAEARGISAQRWGFNAPESARATKELAPLGTALESAVQRLQQSFDQQRHFVSDAAHELKTAVAVVKSSLQLLTMRHRSAAEYEAGLQRSLVDCDRMEQIVAKMLTLARLESSPNSYISLIANDLTASARDVAEQLQPLAELRQVGVRVDCAEAVHVGLSPEECHLLCSNLLINALQHSESAGEVVVTTRLSDGDWVELRVEDLGEGIDEATLAHVFERFYRGDPSRARKTGGTGLGLAICRAIVQRAGGTIDLQSTPGLGTTAVVHLPRVGGPDGERAPLPAVAAVSSA